MNRVPRIAYRIAPIRRGAGLAPHPGRARYFLENVLPIKYGQNGADLLAGSKLDACAPPTSHI
jgi:hypothetical protein